MSAMGRKQTFAQSKEWSAETREVFGEHRRVTATAPLLQVKAVALLKIASLDLLERRNR